MKDHYLGIRVPQQLLDRLDAVVAASTVETSRSTIARAALERGLQHVEADMKIQSALPATNRMAQLVQQLVKRELGLAFVPDVMRKWGKPDAQKVLLAAAKQGLVELRPESGLGRLTDKELSLCPRMDPKVDRDRTPLSWARPL